MRRVSAAEAWGTLDCVPLRQCYIDAMSYVAAIETEGPQRVKLRARDFAFLDERGAFDDYAKTELMEGQVYYMNARHRPHALLKITLYDVLKAGLAASASPLRPLVEVSVALGEHDVPEPDIVLTNEPSGTGFVPGESVKLVVEVADATLDVDLGRKLRAYAAAGVPEYWVADLNGRVIHQLWAPEGDGYREHRQLAFGEAVAAATIAGLMIDTSQIG